MTAAFVYDLFLKCWFSLLFYIYIVKYSPCLIHFLYSSRVDMEFSVCKLYDNTDTVHQKKRHFFYLNLLLPMHYTIFAWSNNVPANLIIYISYFVIPVTTLGKHKSKQIKQIFPILLLKRRKTLKHRLILQCCHNGSPFFTREE